MNISNRFRLLCHQGFIVRARVEVDLGEYFDVTNPAEGRTAGTVPDTGGDKTRRAIDRRRRRTVEGHVPDAPGRGARVLMRGARHALPGTSFEPAVRADVTAARGRSIEARWPGRVQW